MLSKVVSSSIFKVFGMTRPGIEPRSPGPLANTLYNSHNLTSVICLHTICSIWPTDRTLSGATTPDQWIKEWWQWRDTSHSPKLQVYSLTIRWFNVIYRTLVGDAVGVFYKHTHIWSESNPQNASKLQNLQSAQYTKM